MQRIIDLQIEESNVSETVLNYDRSVCFLQVSFSLALPNSRLEYRARIVATITNCYVQSYELKFVEVDIYDTNRWMAEYHRVRSASTANVSPTNGSFNVLSNSNNAAILQLLTWHPRLVFSSSSFTLLSSNASQWLCARCLRFTTWKQRFRSKTKPLFSCSKGIPYTLPFSRKERTFHVMWSLELLTRHAVVQLFVWFCKQFILHNLYSASRESRI